MQNSGQRWTLQATGWKMKRNESFNRFLFFVFRLFLCSDSVWGRHLILRHGTVLSQEDSWTLSTEHMLRLTCMNEHRHKHTHTHTCAHKIHIYKLSETFTNHTHCVLRCMYYVCVCVRACVCVCVCVCACVRISESRACCFQPLVLSVTIRGVWSTCHTYGQSSYCSGERRGKQSWQTATSVILKHTHSDTDWNTHTQEGGENESPVTVPTVDSTNLLYSHTHTHSHTASTVQYLEMENTMTHKRISTTF